MAVLTMPEHPITVRVPATSANLGPGFDCLGLALDVWGIVSVEMVERGRIDDPLERIATAAARRAYEKVGREAPPDIVIRCGGNVPVARGLGASAIARVGGLMAANHLLGEPLGRDDLLALATELEGHADNAAPALFGGMSVAVLANGRIHVAEVPLPAALRAVLFVPEMRMSTKEGRRLLPKTLSREDAVHNIGRAALLVAALSKGRFYLLDAATQDRLHQPARSKLFPAMYDMFDAAKGAGAHCAYLSGGGSTICALATANEQAIAEAMSKAADDRDVAGETMITAPTERGAGLVEDV
jgi:homoserine kinase